MLSDWLNFCFLKVNSRKNHSNFPKTTCFPEKFIEKNRFYQDSIR